MDSREKYKKYKIKGTGVINARRFTDERIRPGFFDEKMKEFNPAYSGLVLQSTWYDAYDCKMISDLVVKELGWDLKKYCIEFNEFNLNISLTTLYTFFLKLGGPVMVLSKSAQMAKTFTNSVEYVITKNERGVFEATISSPKFFAEWNEYMCVGAMFGILKALDRKVKDYHLLGKEKYEASDGPWERRTISVTYD
ncbi:MAG: hypothetical protein RIM99_01740 [Cyclobacteriaceae bacterium]